ncbi:MAG: hypothetical protein RIR48_317, partial [Bacteroidota bacterium]
MLSTIIDFFENLSTLHKFLWIVACLSVFWVLEGIYPLFMFKYDKWKHSKVNLTLLVTTMIINVLFGLATTGIFEWTQSGQIGLLYLIDLPIWLELLIAVMALDL